MRNVMLLWLLASGCLGSRELPLSAGHPSVEIENDTWLQGQPNAVWLRYPNAAMCHFEAWGCVDNPDATMTVLSATCTGCVFVADPTGESALLSVGAAAIASVDGPITIHATLRFDATNTITHVAGTVIGDHEVALVATCALVDGAVLASHHDLPPGELRACDPAGTRSTTDAVLVFPTIHTAHSGDFPGFCTGLDCGAARTVVATPPAAAWGTIDDGFHSPFIVMPPLEATTTAISLSMPLATGELSTFSLAVPPLEASR